ncbi:DsbA family oxidoreductase [Dechloromonas sp. ZY10]|uniref:DsbA family oxidoreductase n=1 Tax=Dechloromonas aquae TaxID=2664436 RepID=UPI0035293E38
MLTLEIVSDIVCPWCYIGTRRLDAALAEIRQEFPDFACRILWRPFFLNPDTPPAGEPYLPFLIDKFGSRERVEAIFAQVRMAGAVYGLVYEFEKIAVRANTLAAHRLIGRVQAAGEDARPLVERLFAAQFVEGKNVGDPEVLLDLAGELGYPREEICDFLASTVGIAELRASEREFRLAGVNSVPTFILDRQLAVVGAEDPARLAAAIRSRLTATAA